MPSDYKEAGMDEVFETVQLAKSQQAPQIICHVSLYWIERIGFPANTFDVAVCVFIMYCCQHCLLDILQTSILKLSHTEQ